MSSRTSPPAVSCCSMTTTRSPLASVFSSKAGKRTSCAGSGGGGACLAGACCAEAEAAARRAAGGPSGGQASMIFMAASPWRSVPPPAHGLGQHLDHGAVLGPEVGPAPPRCTSAAVTFWYSASSRLTSESREDHAGVADGRRPCSAPSGGSKTRLGDDLVLGLRELLGRGPARCCRRSISSARAFSPSSSFCADAAGWRRRRRPRGPPA